MQTNPRQLLNEACAEIDRLERLCQRQRIAIITLIGCICLCAFVLWGIWP